MKLRHGALFNGIGGFCLAAAWMGWENVFSCEIDDFCNKVTKHHFPNCIQHGDIKTTDFIQYRGCIDILTGGFPCQPFSTAGKRRGTEDDRHLWPQMLRSIREIQPRFIVGENVYGLTNWDGGVVFEQVCADLENEGYEVQPVILPACGVNAPHKRDRIWFVANAKSSGMLRIKGNICEADGGQVGGLLPITNEPSVRHDKQGTFTNCTNAGLEGLRPERENTIHGLGVAAHAEGNENIRWGSGGLYAEPAGVDAQRDVTDPENERLQERHGESGIYRSHATTERYNGTSGWQNFPTEPPICGGNDGIPARLDGITIPSWRTQSIKGYGNAIVPQVAFQIFKAIEATFSNPLTQKDKV